MYVQALTLGLTNHCNLACTYCFEGQKHRISMPLGVAKRAIDWFLSEPVSGPVKDLEVTFFGGEPLLEMKAIREIVPYARKRAKLADKEIWFDATTNGTVFTKETAGFWKENNLGLLLSCDGIGEAHDTCRRTRTGHGSFRLVERNLEKLGSAGRSKQVRMTVVPETSKFMRQGVEYLHQQGYQSIAVFHAEEAHWTPEALLEHEKAAYDVGEYYTGVIEKGDPLAIAPLDSYLQRQEPDENHMEESPCGAGRGYVAIGVDGTIYPCHRFLSSDSFKGAYPIGNVLEGFDEAKRLPFLRTRRRLGLGCDIDCNDCSLHGKCSGGCIAANYEVTGHLMLRAPHARLHEKIWANVAESIVEYYRDHRCPAFEEKYEIEYPDNAMAMAG